MFGSTSGEIDGAGTTFDADIKMDGVTVGLQLGYRL